MRLTRSQFLSLLRDRSNWTIVEDEVMVHSSKCYLWLDAAVTLRAPWRESGTAKTLYSVGPFDLRIQFRIWQLKRHLINLATVIARDEWPEYVTGSWK